MLEYPGSFLPSTGLLRLEMHLVNCQECALIYWLAPESEFCCLPWRDCTSHRVSLCSQLCTGFNKKWPAGALILKEWGLEVSRVVTATHGQTHGAQVGRTSWQGLALDFHGSALQ